MSWLARVKVYLTPTCGYCRAAERLLHGKHVAFEAQDVSRDPTTRRWLMQASGQRTVPQIFINGRSIGGYSELSALERAGRLDALLATPPDPTAAARDSISPSEP